MRLDDRPIQDIEGVTHAPLSDDAAGASRKIIAAETGHEAGDRPRGLYRIGYAYGRFIYNVRWLVILLWVAGVAVSVPFVMSVGSLLTGGGYNLQQSDSVKVGDILQSALHQPPSSVQVVFQSAATPVSDPTYQDEVRSFVFRAQTFQHVESVQPIQRQLPDGETVYVPGKDGRTTFVTVNFDTGAGDTEHLLKDFHALLPSGAAPAKAYLTGGPAVYQAFSEITQQDAKTAETRALPLALVVLLAVFGTVAAALLPLMLAVVAVPVALALIYPIAQHMTMSVFVENIASIVGLGISIDYSLFMTRRFREELALGRPVRDAVGWTVATAGEAILFSGLTVMIGFTGLLLIGLQFMTSLGIGGAVVVASAVLAALTLLPAILSVLGGKVNALRLPVLGRLTMPHPDDERAGRGFWQRWAEGVMRRPVVVIVLVTAALVALGWPIFSINIGTPSSASLPTNVEARQGLDILTAQFPQTNDNPVLIVAQAPDGSSMLQQPNLTKLDELSRWIGTVNHVTNVTSLTELPSQTPGQTGPQMTTEQLEALYASGRYQQVPALAQLVQQTTNGNTTVITVKTDAPVDSAAGKQLIMDLRNGQAAHAGGLTVLVGGFQATSLDFNSYLYGNFPRAILFILVATYILLLIMFRSVVLPLKAVLMNVLSVTAAYGVLVFVFQMGHFSSFLGFTADGFIDSTSPILLFCLLFGLSMDYEVFLLSRIHEEWLRTHDNRVAVSRGLAKTGGVITNAALLFVIVTGAFTFTRVISTKEMGLGMTVAVLVDATIIRSLLVPATMRLLGRWNWWLPGRPLPPKQPYKPASAEAGVQAGG